jgi:hypothetical protein
MLSSLDRGWKFLGLALLAPLALALAPDVRAQTLDTDRDEIIYTVRAGDTLSDIAYKYMRHTADHVAVRRLNALGNDRALPVGSRLRLPTALLKSSPIAAEIIAFRGDVAIVSGKATRAARLAAPIEEQMIVQTGRDGFVTIRTASGSRYSLPSMTRVRINRLRRYLISGGNDIEVEVLSGRLEVGAAKQTDDRSGNRIRTPVAVSAVRGTTFRIGYDGASPKGAASLTEVVEGSVAVASQAAPNRDVLPAGFGAAVQPSGEVRREALLPPPDMVRADMRQTSRDLGFAVAPLTGAVGYRVQVARDAAFGDLMVDGTSDSLTLTLPDIPDGQYHVRANAIAPSGLEGLTQSQQFERLRFALSAEKIPAAADAQQRVNFRWDVYQKQAGPFRFQLFAAGTEGAPLIDEIGLEREELLVTGLAPGSYQWRIQMMGLATHPVDQRWSPRTALVVD